MHEGTGRMCQMLRDGELDMAVLVTEGAVRDILTGGPHRIVSSFVDSPLPWGVHVPARSTLGKEDLKGTPYAISRMGSGSHIMAMLHAGKQGWRPTGKDLEVVHNMAGAAERMQHGPPVLFLWERYVTQRYVDAGLMRRVDVIRAPWPGFVITARNGFAERHPEAVERALGILRSETEALKDGPHAAGLVMRNAGFGEAVAHEWLQHARWKVAPVVPSSLDELGRTLAALDLI
ncbi:MAG: ABC transporter substrate-binding protein [Flavobacteriales bacterium]|nr:ABC transporter substrate-binding protein [Flavobacteriales bacterium]MBP9079440.1 ABC transporter substrate-binding protein [Flavobacteriales bacterium]